MEKGKYRKSMTHKENKQSGDLYISWDEYNKKIEELAVQINDELYGFEFNQIVCIAKGGNSLAKTTPNLGNKVLLVDDLADSGRTLEKCVEWLKHYEGFFIDDLRTATLWTKGLSTFTPDYYVEYLPNNPWIHQPFEKYEKMLVEELNREL